MIGILSSQARFLNIDDRQVARLKLGGYIALPTTPGPHTITSTDFSTFGDANTGKVMASARFTMSTGSVRYFRYTEGFKSLTAIPINGTVVFTGDGEYHFEEVTPQVAMKELEDTKQLEPSER